MSRRARRPPAPLALGVVLVGFGVLVPLAVRAGSGDPSAEPVRVRFDAPPGCPDAARFFDEIQARTVRARRASEGESARVFRVTVRRQAGGMHGKLIVEESSHATSPRTVDGASCEDVVSALALAAALAIDPQASLARTMEGADSGSAARDDGGVPVTESDPASDPSPVDASSPPDAALPDVSIAPDAGISSPTGPPALARREDDANDPRTIPAWHWGGAAGALFDVVGAAAPGAVFGASAFAQAERSGDAVISPALRIGFAGYGDHAVTYGPGTARFTWWVGTLDVCPLRFAIGSRLRAAPCVTSEVGALVASGSGVSNPQSRVRPWGSLGGVVRLEWRVLGRLSLEAYTGLRRPITRESFVFDPGAAIYEPPSRMLVGGVGVGVHFP